MKRLVLIIPIAFLLSLFFPRCAIIVPPTGGPKDTIPPVLVRSVPNINSTNFKGEKVIITFDEYIRLDKIGEKLVLSPPQERLPEFKVKGKGVELKFYEPLEDSTTYTLYFADAIVDNNEANKLLNFEFAFSTGPVIDSLKFTGKVIDALTLNPQEGVFVMLYDRLEDSIPMKEKPRYVTKTDKKGKFILSNLKQNRYKIFALRDENTNYKFDQITEGIAYKLNPIDTSMLLKPSDMAELKDTSFMLRLFKEENMILLRTDFSRNQRRMFSLGFSRRPEGEIKITPLNLPIDSLEQWYKIGTNLKGDSLNYWILSDKISKIDSLTVTVDYLKTDSVLNLVETTDTLRLFYFEQTSTPKRKGKGEVEKPMKEPSLPVKLSIKAGASVLPNKPLKLTFNMPLINRDSTLINLMNMTDSTTIQPFNFEVDSLDPRVFIAKHEWKANTQYTFTVFPGAFTNLDSISNDTLMVSFKGADPEKFGIISIDLKGVNPNVIVELTNDKGVAFDTRTVVEDGIVKFNYVTAGKYNVRFIIDENKNGKWDTGHYLKGIQPEQIIVYEDDKMNKEIQVRANWEYEIKFNLEKK